MRAGLFAIVLSFLLPDFTFAATSCGGDVACRIEGGDYRIELPHDGDVRGVYVYFHGYKSSAMLQMRQRKIVETTLSHHLAYVAVDGIDGSWSFPNSARNGRDEKTFIAGLFDDLKLRYGFTPQKTVIGGFSIGASMAWYTACEQGGRAAAMLTFSGVFWNPLPKPESCVSDIPPLLHFHGTADRTFPLEGRPIGIHFHQGNAFKSLAILRSSARCSARETTVVIDGIMCNVAPSCIRGASTICIHNGGHEVKTDMLDWGLTRIGFPK